MLAKKILYRLNGAALQLNTFTVAELQSLTDATAEEVDAFMRVLSDPLLLARQPSRRLSLTKEGMEHLLKECFDLAEQLIKEAESQRARVKLERFVRENKFLQVHLIAKRVEALMRGARPKIDLANAKAVRIAMEEVRSNLVQWDDPPEPIVVESDDAAEEELYFEFGKDEEEEPPIQLPAH